MSKKRREKTKAKQRRHSDNIVPNKTPAPVSNQPASQQAQATSKQVQQPAKQAQTATSPSSISSKQKPAIVKTTPIPTQPYIQNKHLEHAAPLWKNFYKAVSESTLRY
jgi:hypothetical protein